MATLESVVVLFPCYPSVLFPCYAPSSAIPMLRSSVPLCCSLSNDCSLRDRTMPMLRSSVPYYYCSLPDQTIPTVLFPCYAELKFAIVCKSLHENGLSFVKTIVYDKLSIVQTSRFAGKTERGDHSRHYRHIISDISKIISSGSVKSHA